MTFSIRLFAFLSSVLFLSPMVFGQLASSVNFKEVAFNDLSDRNLTQLGSQAIAVRSAEWKHGESDHFIYHYFEPFVGSQVSHEAEFYYNVTAKDLGKDTSQWERKCHIFIFDQPADWEAFQTKGKLDPWTGGLTAEGALFVLRNVKYKWKGNTLAHEIAHLVVYRFFGNGIPLWLNEGFAEYAGTRGYAWFYRNRGYRAAATVPSIDPKHYIPIAELTSMLDYPAATEKVETFYDESHRLVWFFSHADKTGFGKFFEAMAQGNRMETALSRGYGNRFFDLKSVETQFRDYATKEFGSSLQDQQ